MEQEKTPLRKFIEQLEAIEKGCNSPHSPAPRGEIFFYLEPDDWEDDIKYLEVVEIEPSQELCGCNSWYGASISFKIKNEEQ